MRTLVAVAVAGTVGLLPMIVLSLYPRGETGALPEPKWTHWAYRAFGVVWLLLGFVFWWRFAIGGLVQVIALEGATFRPFALLFDGAACSAWAWAGLDVLRIADRIESQKSRST